MFKKFFAVLSIIVLTFSISSPMIGHASEIGYGEQEQIQMANQLSNYFEVDENGDIIFTADKETLMEIGISESDAELMISAGTELTGFTEVKKQTRGFVGLYLNLGPTVRGMSALAAGAFAGGFVGWHVKQIAAAGPWGAGAAAVITASTAGVVGWAVNNGLKKTSVGVNIPYVDFNYTVDIP